MAFSIRISSLCATISGNKFIASYRKMRGTNCNRNSWVYEKCNFDLFYRQINITAVSPFKVHSNSLRCQWKSAKAQGSQWKSYQGSFQPCGLRHTKKALKTYENSKSSGSNCSKRLWLNSHQLRICKDLHNLCSAKAPYIFS